MRKRAFVRLAGILCAFALTVPVFAASYVDDCDSLAPDGTRSYGGFSEAVGDFDVFSGWGTCGDATALAVGGREAQATYRVSGAESVEVSFYASLSTCATPYGKDAFTLGGQSAEALLNARRCFYDRAADVVFLTENGRNFSLQYDPFYGLLLREDGRPLSDDCFWGAQPLRFAGRLRLYAPAGRHARAGGVAVARALHRPLLSRDLYGPASGGHPLRPGGLRGLSVAGGGPRPDPCVFARARAV